MAKRDNSSERSDRAGAGRDPLTNDLERQSSVPNDLPDSPEDQEKLANVESTIDLPDVKDIPGQEFINAPPMGELADTTISSADEEGAGVFDDVADRLRGGEGDVTEDEMHALERTDYMPTTDEDRLQRASLDSVDFQGEPLNEKGFGEGRGDTLAPDDLDTNTEDDDTTSSAMGDGDEENKTYSLGSADNDNVTEGTP